MANFNKGIVVFIFLIKGFKDIWILSYFLFLSSFSIRFINFIFFLRRASQKIYEIIFWKCSEGLSKILSISWSNFLSSFKIQKSNIFLLLKIFSDFLNISMPKSVISLSQEIKPYFPIYGPI